MNDKKEKAKIEKNVKSALHILVSLGLPRAQHNVRSALCLLALLNIQRRGHGALHKTHFWASHQS